MSLSTLNDPHSASSHDLALRAKVLISVESLRALLQSGSPVVLLDVRPHSDESDPRAGYRSGHLPGAVYADLATELAGQGGGTKGRLPLPEIHDLQRDARRWGIRKDSAVVVYGDNGPSGRTWWVLRWAGFENVRLLDGGLAAWTRAGHPLTKDIPLPSPGDVTLSSGHLPVLDADAAASLAREGVLLDARGKAQYAGGPVKSGEAATGHIPGALSFPTTGNLTEDGHFADPETLKARFSTLGAEGKKVGVYCGGGVAASHEIAALASIGLEAALFPGSWSAWSSDSKRPVATGTEPG